jgi:hypothetical protein
MHSPFTISQVLTPTCVHGCDGVGAGVGAGVGVREGASVGEVVGVFVGAGVGVSVGYFVGAGVGFFVGAAVAHGSCTHGQFNPLFLLLILFESTAL